MSQPIETGRVTIARAATHEVGELSPGELLVLIHHHCFPEWNQHKSAFYRDALVKLTRMELIEPWDNDGAMPDGYRTTERGRVHVEAICKKALPEKKWVSS